MGGPGCRTGLIGSPGAAVRVVGRLDRIRQSSLVLKTALKGKKITVKVVAHRTGHKDGSAVSKATKAVVK